MPKSKASKEPPKVKEDEAPAECEVTSPAEEEVAEEPPVAETPKVVEETPVSLHLAKIVIDSFGDEDQDPLFTGVRTVLYHGGHTYTGEFVEGKMCGEGEYTWAHGLKYKGEFKDNIVSGKGEYLWPDGSVYKGDVQDGFRHGQGTFFCSSSPSIYSGDWLHGSRTGNGKMIYDKDGMSYYVGQWRDNKKWGQGFRQYPSGSTYQGTWLDNHRHGKGTMQWAGTGETYIGEWKMGVQDGEGTHIWLVDTSSQLPLRNEYRGQWEQGRRQGVGMFSYASGSRYEGEWANNAKHGYGKFFFKDGSVFSGNFENDSIIGRPGSPDFGKMMRSAIATGRISSPLQNSSKTSQSSFQLNIRDLVSDEIFHDEELEQVHNVLLRHISVLRQVYNHYCKLGDLDSGILLRMEFWKLLKDSQMYQKLAMPDADGVISDAVDIECETERTSPFTHFLFREFLQAIVYLAVHMYSGNTTRENGTFIAKCLSSLLHDHLLSLDLSNNTGYSHSHPANKQYIERCWNLYQRFSKRTDHCFTLRDILFMLKDLKLLGTSYPHLNVNSVVDDVMVATNDNMSAEGELYLDIHVNFYDFFNVLCGCALVIKHSSPTPYHIHSHMGTETDMSGGGILISPDKTPLPPGSESPTKSHSKKNTPSETPIQTPAPSAPDTDNNDGDGSTPLVESVASLENAREQSLLISPSIDERCGSFEDWSCRIEDFFMCHFFPAAEKLIEVEERIIEKWEKEREEEKIKEAEQEEIKVPTIELDSASMHINLDVPDSLDISSLVQSPASMTVSS